MQVTQYEFDELCLNDRLHLLWAVGTLVSRVKSFKHTYVLYALYGFYVELVVTYKGKATSVTSAVAFRDANRLNKHLAEIDLSDLSL